jgi:chemotaxis protein MotB
MQSVPELARLAENLEVERAPEGLRIQIVDQIKTSMFPIGSARMYRPTEALLSQVARVIAKLPNKISIAGHTDGIAYRRTDGYDNWSLSLDRADATRRTLVAAGLDQGRIATVIGKADAEHMFPGNPRDPAQSPDQHHPAARGAAGRRGGPRARAVAPQPIVRSPEGVCVLCRNHVRYAAIGQDTYRRVLAASLFQIAGNAGRGSLSASLAGVVQTGSQRSRARKDHAGAS